MKTKCVFTSLLLTATFATLISCSAQDNNSLIVGKWRFDKFYMDEEVSDQFARDLEANSKANKGLLVFFYKDGRYVSVQRGGREENNISGKYRIIPGNKVIIMGDTVKIIQLDRSLLKLYSRPDRPLVLFRKEND